MDSGKRGGVARAFKSTSSKGKKAGANNGDDWSRKAVGAANCATAGSRGVHREAGLPPSDRSGSPSSSLDGVPSETRRRRRQRPGPADGYDSASASESSDAAAARATAAAPAAGGQLPKLQQQRSTSCESSDAASAQRLVRGSRLSKESSADFLVNFDPDCSSREMRKVNRRIAEDRLNNASKSQTLYDGQGCFLEDGSDICDCLEEGCHGCFLTCAKCGSTKCGTSCRSNRRWMVETIEVEGVAIVRQHPHLQNTERKTNYSATLRTADLSTHTTHFRTGTH